MHWFLSLIGALLVFAALHDLFHTLFHPAGRGAISDWLCRGIWVFYRKLAHIRPNAITFAGPVATLAVMLSWVSFVVVGFTLLIYPNIDVFVVAPGMDASHHRALFDAFNISLGSLITLGGDFNSRSKYVRFLMGMEALMGFAILTASVSWLLSIYPVLEHRRSLAHQVTLLHNGELVQRVNVQNIPESDLFNLLGDLATQLSTVRNELVQFPITYYFHVGERITAFPGVLQYLFELADECSRDHSDSIRLMAAVLGGAVHDYAFTVRDTYFRMPELDTQQTIEKYRIEHLRERMPHDASRRPRAA